jgi:type VI secretion system protein ImpH
VRAAQKYRLPLAYERADRQEPDTISSALLALVGMGQPSLRHRQSVSDEALVFYCGHFTNRLRTADGLGQMLSEYFERAVTIRQFQGRWVSWPQSEQTRLGGGFASSDAYATLGANAVLGSQVWDVQGSFRVRLGPLDYDQFLQFLPGGKQMAELVALTRTYVGPVLSFDVQLTLQASEVPALELSTDARGGGRLGWNTWLPSQRRRDAVSDAIFRVETV